MRRYYDYDNDYDYDDGQIFRSSRVPSLAVPSQINDNDDDLLNCLLLNCLIVKLLRSGDEKMKNVRN